MAAGPPSLCLIVSNVIKLVHKEAHPRGRRAQKKQKKLSEGKMDSKTRRRILRLKQKREKDLSCRGVAGGNAVPCDFGPWRSPSGADREQFSPEERERIGDWLSEESTAGKNGVREIDAAFILGCALSGICGPDGGLGEVEDEKTGKDLLEDEVRLLRMEMDEANGVFQAAEGSLDPPAHGVEALQGGRREALRIQVGNEKLGTAVFCFNTDDPERKDSKTSAFRL